MSAAKPLYRWIRETYAVTEPESPGGEVIVIDKESEVEVGRWPEGCRVDDEIYRRYLDEVPGAKEELAAFLTEYPEFRQNYVEMGVFNS